MKLFKNAKRTLSLLLTVVMALTMMSVMSVSAEDTTTETETVSVYDRFTWSPLRNVTVSGAGETVESPATTKTVELVNGVVPATTTTKTVETVDNGDGTVTSYKVTTTITYADNGDGTANETTTVSKVPYILVNPSEKNTNFKFGIYSDRDGDNARGTVYATKFEGYQIYVGGTYAFNFGIPGSKNWHLNQQHKLTIADSDSHSLSSGAVINAKNAYYMTTTQTIGMEDTVIFRATQYNEMWLEFTAPSDGVYEVSSGSISKVLGNNGNDVDGDVTYCVIKVDKNNVWHTLSTSAEVPVNSEWSEIPNVKAQLETGEKLVLKTDNTSSTQVAKVFLQDYLVTKWDYAEADDTDLTDGDNSTVTVNYGYQNHNVLNVYGENYAIGDSNFETLWNVKAARYYYATNEFASTDETDLTKATADFNSLNKTVNSGSTIRHFTSGNANNSYFCKTASGGTINPGIDYNADGSLIANIWKGALDDDVDYKIGLQFTFTMPEDGTVVLTGASKTASDNNIARVGIRKKGSDEVVYGIYYNTGGTNYGTEDGVWSQLRFADTTNYREHTIGKLEAGDVIYYEISRTDETTTYGTRTADLSTLNVAITTSNSVADINGDFKGDATDTVYMRKFLLRTFEAADKSVFDVTGDGNSDIRDLVKIKKLIAGIYE